MDKFTFSTNVKSIMNHLDFLGLQLHKLILEVSGIISVMQAFQVR